MDFAQMLYTREAITQKEVAQRVGVSENTMSKWVRVGGWETMRVSITVTREQTLRRMYMHISEINDAIADRDPGNRYPTAKEADAINKIAAAIDKLEREVGAREVINVSKAFLDWLRRIDLSAAQDISGFFDMYIKEIIK